MADERWESRNEPYQRGANTKRRLGVNVHGIQVRAIITQGRTADYLQAIALIDGFEADYLLADRGFDTIIEQARVQGMTPIIPPKCNRKAYRNADKGLYQARHLVENAFLYLKQWGGIATRYAQSTASFLATFHIRRVFLWASIS